ncbi:MAG: metallophosphoesterase, partial [Bacteroidetes bacterium]|nr:metallophosphoesterase [Bacteroidota bacterium]
MEFKEQLLRLKAPMGVYSILGNHDYGDYFRWDTQEEKARNLVDLKNFHGELGWKLLLNSHTYLEKEGEKIGLIGVENWSSRMNFHRYGDMEMAMAGMEKTPFTI